MCSSLFHCYCIITKEKRPGFPVKLQPTNSQAVSTLKYPCHTDSNFIYHFLNILNSKNLKIQKLVSSACNRHTTNCQTLDLKCLKHFSIVGPLTLSAFT